MTRPAVLMTDPRGFAITGGCHPRTRNPDGSLKQADVKKAAKQWRRYADQLEAAGVDVYVVPAVPNLTGMVFAGHAGAVKPELASYDFPTGDSCALAVGSQLFVYPAAFTPAGLQALKAHFGAGLRPLSEADARALAANSFCVSTESGPVAFVPEGISDA